jgi:hypothetical protein
MRGGGAEIIVISAGRTYYYENRLPHALAYNLPGEWAFAVQEAGLRTSGGRQFIGVLLRDYPGPSTTTPVSRGVTALRNHLEQTWRTPLKSTVTPFPTPRYPGAVVLEFAEVRVTPEIAARVAAQGGPPPGQVIGLPTTALVPFDDNLVMLITFTHVENVREVLDTLEVTEDKEVWGPAIHARFPGVLRSR